MVDDENRENLANARRKLKKFRDQQQPPAVETNGSDVHALNGPSIELAINSNNLSQNPVGVIRDQLAVANGVDQSVSRSPVPNFLESNRQNGLPVENQRLSSGGSQTSRRSSQTSVDSEQKLRRDNEHLQEQLEVHVQTIGILVADKTDISAKLTQSFKQLERKQGEMDELYGRLKASRERVQELEKQMQNSTSNVQKREMAAKESDKENDRLKIENIRQSQLIEDFKQNINELNEKLRERQTNLDQLNNELQQWKSQSQLSHETSTAEQHVSELEQTLAQKNNQIEELISSVNRMRSDNEQYQQYNTNMQHHIQELTTQVNQLTETNKVLQNEQSQMRLTDHSSVLEHDNLQQENQLFRNAIDQWSNRYEDLRVKLEEMTKLSTDKDEQITQLKATINQSNELKTDNQFDAVPNLKNHLQAMDDKNRELNERLEQLQTKAGRDEEIQTEDLRIELPPDTNIADQHDSLQHVIERYNQVMNENTELKDRIQHLEHVILQLQSETETIGDYIRLYQQQREQLQRRQQEKDDSIKQLAQERLNLQKKLSELQILLIHALNIPLENSIPSPESKTEVSGENTQSSTNENGQSETNGDAPKSTDSSASVSVNSMVLAALNDERKARLLSLIEELGENHFFSPSNATSSSVKLAFVDQNFYICSTCSGPVQWV